jgi:hypothetical protein
VNAEEVIAKLSRVFASRDWQAMRALYHPDALVFTVTGGPDPLAADELIAELERVSEDFVYLVTPAETIPVDDHAAIITGRMRRRLPAGGFEDAGHVWLLPVRDGLVYRQAVHHDPEAAREAYARLGVTLGVPDPA